MRVLFLITGLGMGGAEMQVTALAHRMVQRGHEVRIAYMTGPILVGAGLGDLSLDPLRIKKNPLSLVSGACRLAQLIRRFQPDVVHSHMVHANLLARLVRPVAPIPRLICTAHNRDEGGRLRMWAYRITDRLADLSTNVSQEAVEAFEQRGAVPRGRMVVVYNGIDVQHFRKLENEGPRPSSSAERQDDSDGPALIVQAVGRLEVAKNYPLLLNAFRRVHARIPSARLRIAGDGTLAGELKTLAVDLGLSDYVTFLGRRNDIVELMNTADVFVLSSSWEGFGLVVAEAMACEKVAVATDCGGVREVLGNCGLLVPVDDEAALTAAIERALRMDAGERQALGRRARARVVEQFSLDRAVDRWLAIYKGRDESLRTIGSTVDI